MPFAIAFLAEIAPQQHDMRDKKEQGRVGVFGKNLMPRSRVIFDALDGLDDIAVNVFLRPNPKAGLLDVPYRVSIIEVGADAPGEWRHQVEKYSERTDPAPHVFEHQNLAARLQYPVHLTKTNHGPAWSR
jgi:hypothetical protein